MSDDYSFFWIYVWLGILLGVMILFTLPTKHTDLKHLLMIVTTFLVVTIGGPFMIKSTWDKYHVFEAGKIQKLKDLSYTISIYEIFGPKGPAIFESLLYIFGVRMLGVCVRAQHRKWHKKEPSQ